MLPPELRNRLSRLVLEGPPSAASVVLLDERWRRRPVGMLAGDLATADTPFAGPLYYLRRALAPFTEVREADLATLLQRELSVLILADRPLPAGAERDALTQWVEQGGLLIRFAGPRTAEQPLGETDPLMPVKLLGGDRQLGGALSWAEPAGVAQFPATSPFAGLTVPEEVKVNRQVLAEPSADLAGHTWAALADGTPLVTAGDARRRTRSCCSMSPPTPTGPTCRCPACSWTCCGGWSRCRRASRRSPDNTRAGAGRDAGRLRPAVQPPPQAATGLPANEIRPHAGLAAPSARAVRTGERPAGAEPGRQSAGPARPRRRCAGARIENYAAAAPERALGPPLLAAAVVLLALDLLIALGAARPAAAEPGRRAAVAGCCCWSRPARACARRQIANPALATRLGYIVTGDGQLDGVSRAGLGGLSDYVNRRTAATLVEPDAVQPGKTDLSFYPLLYWPISADAQPLATEPGGGAERLHEPRRHHPDRHARFRLGRGLRAGHRGRRCSGSRRGW